MRGSTTLSRFDPKCIRFVNNGRSTLGEGLCYLPQTKSMIWCDIDRGVVRRFSDDLQVLASAEVELASSACLTQSGEVVVTGNSKVYFLDPDSLTLTRPSFELQIGNGQRTNEGKIAPNGYLYIGVMSKVQDGSEGGILAMDLESGEHQKLPVSLTIPNTFEWDLDGKRFYFADSHTGELFTCDLDNGLHPVFSSRRRFSKLEDCGTPDGSTFIRESRSLINCRWGGGCLIEFSSSGEIEDYFALPVEFPTDVWITSNAMIVTSAASNNANWPNGETMVFPTA